MRRSSASQAIIGVTSQEQYVQTRVDLKPSYRICKRVFDVLGAYLLLILFGPLFLAIAVAVRLTSSGPILFRQARVGQHGQTFYMLKFRSMYADSDSRIHQEHVTRLIKENTKPDEKGSLKLKKDPRITPIGAFIRKTSLDELPQFINVLRGEMSLVGPRPHISYEVDLYKDWQYRRLSVLPGITGLWQISGRNTTSFDEAIKLDISYIDQASSITDIKILILTPLTMVRGRGAG